METTMMIDITDLRVRYGSLNAVDGVSLQVRQGEVFGLLGPNGAGKTSTLACIEGLRRPDGGSVAVHGFDVARQAREVKMLLGVQLQKSALFENLNALELLQFYAALYNRFPTRAEATALLERFGLAQKAASRAAQLSGGQQQRLAIALALVNDPQVVLLDEPTASLDPQARRGVWALIRRLQHEGRTVLLTTHYLEEAEFLCDRVGIIDDGKLLALDTPSNLIQQYAPSLPPEEAARRQPNLEDAYLALTGRAIHDGTEQAQDEETAWLASMTV